MTADLKETQNLNPERILDADEESLVEMLDTISAGIVMGYFDGPAGKFTSVNRYFCEMLGLEADDIITREESGDLNDNREKQGLLEAIHPDDLNLVFNYFMSMCEGEGRAPKRCSVSRRRLPRRGSTSHAGAGPSESRTADTISTPYIQTRRPRWLSRLSSTELFRSCW